VLCDVYGLCGGLCDGVYVVVCVARVVRVVHGVWCWCVIGCWCGLAECGCFVYVRV
jgi:hypothetical protein